MPATTTIPTTIGRDNGVNGFFFAEVERTGQRAHITICAAHLQEAGAMLRTYEGIYGFTTISLR